MLCYELTIILVMHLKPVRKKNLQASLSQLFQQSTLPRKSLMMPYDNNRFSIQQIVFITVRWIRSPYLLSDM